jgi:hypothetical protein
MAVSLASGAEVRFVLSTLDTGRFCRYEWAYRNKIRQLRNFFKL